MNTSDQPDKIDWPALVLSGQSVVCIGQVDPATRARLERMARRGEIRKYRGYWNTLSPVEGLGPLKTIFAPLD